MGVVCRIFRLRKLLLRLCMCIMIIGVGWQIKSLTKQAVEGRKESAEWPRGIPSDRTTVGNESNFPSSKSNRKDGFLRAATLLSLCKNESQSSAYKLHDRVRVDYSEVENTVFCPMCKVSSTFWTRVFRMMEFNNKSLDPKYLTPFDVPISKAPPHFDFYNTSTKEINKNIDASQAFRLLFVRDPYSLLFSAYTDKIVKPTVNFINSFGKPAVRRLRKVPSNGNDVTFPEFVDEVVFQYRKSRRTDCHVRKFDICRPCSMNYSFVGTLETFKQDTMDVLSFMHQKKTTDIFTKHLAVLHADDAIEDVTNGVFDNRKTLLNVLPWSDAVKRIWRNLQIRGILGHKGFSLTKEESEVISKNELIRLLKMTFRNATSEDRKTIKKQAYLEAYRGISVELLHKVREVYKEDFKLFQYDDMPAELFDRSRKVEVYGLMNYSNIRSDLKPLGIYV